jgi:hypothetical protein
MDSHNLYRPLLFPTCNKITEQKPFKTKCGPLCAWLGSQHHYRFRTMSDTLLLATPARSRSRFTPKQVALFFFKPLLDDNEDPTDYHVCKACGKYRKQTPGKGFSNLESHVRLQHPTYEREMANAGSADTVSLISWVSKKASNRFSWMEWIIKAGLPLSFCE